MFLEKEGERVMVAQRRALSYSNEQQRGVCVCVCCVYVVKKRASRDRGEGDLLTCSGMSVEIRG